MIRKQISHVKNSSYLMYRLFSSHHLEKDVDESQRNFLYQNAMNISECDTGISIDEKINKGFAYLFIGKDKNNCFSLNAMDCFNSAKKDVRNITTEKDKQFYDDIINCGIAGANNNEFSFHVIKPR